jgi:hypothetical protein
MYGVSCCCNGRFDLGQMGSVRSEDLINRQRQTRSRGRHPCLRPLKRARWSDITMEPAPNWPHGSHDAAIIHAHDFGGHTVVT